MYSKWVLQYCMQSCTCWESRVQSVQLLYVPPFAQYGDILTYYSDIGNQQWITMNHSSQINCHTTIRNCPRLVQWIVNASAYILSREYMLIIIVCSSVGGGLLPILVLIFILCCIYRQCSGKRKTKSFVSFASNLNFNMVSQGLSQLIYKD